MQTRASHTSLDHHAKFSVAPMMAWTDRHCRWFHRQLSQHALLYTEMVTAAALVHGDAARLLEHHHDEHPVAVQLGGSDPDLLRQATRIAVDHGYTEVNLNCGCPSDRVQSGTFGAVLMTVPDTVADCVAAMQTVAGAEVTVKCRIGVDDQDPSQVLPEFLEKVGKTGVRRFTIHARKAWLKGLSPKENREVPPLDYALALQMKSQFPDFHLSLNGGISETAQAQLHLQDGFDGAMIGRAAYHTPFDVLSTVDRLIFGGSAAPARLQVAQTLSEYISDHMASGGRMHHVTRHILGLFAGEPGARMWRRSLSELGADPNATIRDYDALVSTMMRTGQAAQQRQA